MFIDPRLNVLDHDMTFYFMENGTKSDRMGKKRRLNGEVTEVRHKTKGIDGGGTYPNIFSKVSFVGQYRPILVEGTLE
jgi:hypothetical protein